MMKKKWIITGAAGFIGYRFYLRAAEKNIPVLLVDKLAHFQTRTSEHGLPDASLLVDRAEFLKTLSTQNPAEIGAIIHIGACSDTTEMREDYLRETNVEYSQTLWNYCAKHGIPFLYASSAATYGAGELGYEDREDLTPQLKPLNPYGESKRAFDEWALAEEKKGNHPPNWAGFKFFNVYGFGEGHKNKMASVVYHAYRQIEQTGRVKLFQSHKAEYKDGEQMRDFVAVSDVIDVLVFALEKPIKRGIYNLGSGKARTFLDLARAVFAALGKKEAIDFVPTPESLRDRYQYFTEAPMGKLEKAGYTRGFTSLEQGVRETVELLSKLS